MSAEQQTLIIDHFINQRYREGLEITKGCLQESPSSSLLLNKAMFQYRLGNIQQAMNDISQSLILDPLNHHAYFNLFSININQNKPEPAYKDLCCALSVLHLLIAKSSKEEQHIEKAIQYSFNNKEARALKSIIKLSNSKNIEALNMINYALYLDPSNCQLVTIQKAVYQKVGMKELKGLIRNQKAKFERLETCKEIPSDVNMDKVIKEMLEEFNLLLTKIQQKNVYIVTPPGESSKQTIKEVIKEQPSIRWVEVKQVEPIRPKPDDEEKVTVCSSRSNDEESSKCQTIPASECSISMARPDKQPSADFSFSKIDSISISNISMNSLVKISRVKNNHILDISDCIISLLEQAGSNKILPEDSLDQSRENQRLELKLPMDSIRGLAQNQKIVLAIQRVKTSPEGVKEEVEELYEIVASSAGIELVKSQQSS